MLLVVGIIIGIILYNIMPSINQTSLIINLDNLKDQLLSNHLNNLFPHILAICVISILSLTIIGYFTGLFYLFYIGMSIGFTTAFLIVKYGLKGLIFSFLYSIIFKMIYICVLIVILVKLYEIVKNIIGLIIYKKNDQLIANFRHNYLSILILLFIIIINDLILSLSSTFILKIITSML
jgi:hypothetical protein